MSSLNDGSSLSGARGGCGVRSLIGLNSVSGECGVNSRCSLNRVSSVSGGCRDQSATAGPFSKALSTQLLSYINESNVSQSR